MTAYDSLTINIARFHLFAKAILRELFSRRYMTMRDVSCPASAKIILQLAEVEQSCRYVYLPCSFPSRPFVAVRIATATATCHLEE